LKLSSLFAKYLYQHKKLRLPGIGVFTLDPTLSVPDASDKSFPEFLNNIRFSQEAVSAPDDEFINFIRTETGKIKPLAESDLDSYLSDGKILLNIGKPFHIEGIGSLQKVREGMLEFNPGDVHHHKTDIHTHEPEESTTKSKTFYLDTTTPGTGVRKILIALGAIAGIIIVIWGGYILYNRNGAPPSAGLVDSITSLPPRPDSLKISAMPDSFQHGGTDSQGRHNYKFVIERTANKGRALRRYNQLVGLLEDVKMESKDSTLFKLYFVLPAFPSDTARIRDSLKVWYGRKIVYVE
jgi:hypothetical protein